MRTLQPALVAQVRLDAALKERQRASPREAIQWQTV
jgi:hypothetical protein